MEIISHLVNNKNIAKVFSKQIVFQTNSDGLDLIGNVYYQNFDKIILYKENISVDFFVLRNEIASEMLQKFSN